jgi:hypothetical protein
MCLENNLLQAREDFKPHFSVLIHTTVPIVTVIFSEMVSQPSYDGNILLTHPQLQCISKYSVMASLRKEIY